MNDIAALVQRVLKERKHNFLLLTYDNSFPSISRELLRVLAKSDEGKKVFFGSLKSIKEVALGGKARESYFLDSTELIFSLLKNPLLIESLTSFLKDASLVVFLGYAKLFDFLKGAGLYFRFAEALQDRRVVLAEVTAEDTLGAFLPWKEPIDINEVIIISSTGDIKRIGLL